MKIATVTDACVLSHLDKKNSEDISHSEFDAEYEEDDEGEAARDSDGNFGG